MPSLLLNQPKLPLVFSRRKERRNAPVAKSSAVRSMSALLSNAERPDTNFEAHMETVSIHQVEAHLADLTNRPANEGGFIIAKNGNRLLSSSQ